MFKDILAGNINPQMMGMQGMSMPQQPQPMPQQMPVMVDMYGQQQSGLRQALMGGMNGFRL